MIDDADNKAVSQIPVIDNASRREKVREAMARYRKRRRRGFYLRPIMVTKAQLDELEVRGYLDPVRRGERLDECDAIESFLADSLVKSR